MRICPTVQGSPSPLIIHRIGLEVCLARQATFFHKCHKCIYRGKAADWEPEDPQELTIEIGAMDARKNGTHKPARKPSQKSPTKKAPAKSRPEMTPGSKPDKVVESEA